jgi:hypothetical protein
MKTRKKYVIEGNVDNLEGDDFHTSHLAVRAFVEGKEVACAEVDKKNHYRLMFEGGEEPPVTELRVLPLKLAHNGRDTLAVSKIVSPQRYMMKPKDQTVLAHYDLHIPHEYLHLMLTVSKTYQMHGAVYATTFVAGLPVSIEPLPAAKIEFFEVDIPPIWLYGTTPTETEAYLGYAYSGPDGSYTFDFDFSYRLGMYWLFMDRIPDIRARISQFVDGGWTEIYSGPVDWNIVESFHRDYFIPVEDIVPVPATGVKPEEGLRYISLGLLPIDDTRIVDGYAFAQPGDPASVAAVSHQPFCGTLRIFGLFAEVPPVASYKVEMATADADGPIGPWQVITDPLVNQKWNGVTRVWEPVVLGPDPVTLRYKNIDNEAEADWHEHALKVTWRSSNWPNGYYALRMVAYDAGGSVIGTFPMPVLRVDNSIPEVDLDAMGTSVGAVGICGALTLGLDRQIHMRVTAFDPEGHVWQYWLSGTRGKDAFTAGPMISDNRDSHDPAGLWIGVKDAPISFTVANLPPALAGCATLAYNMELHVWGLSTDGYDAHPTSQWRHQECNLVVSEP